MPVPEILIVAATPFEIEGLCRHLQLPTPSAPGLLESGRISVLITGVGMVNTAYFMGRHASNRYDLLVNAGVCGAFDRSLPLGTVVSVREDTLSELGAEDGENFIRYPEMGLGGTNVYTMNCRQLPKAVASLPAVNAITQNTVHGHEPNIQQTLARYAPQVESMEGAAFFRGCEALRGESLQLRAVSNYVERRDRSKWNLPLAISNLNQVLIQLLNDSRV